MANVITGRELLKQLCEALDFDEHVKVRRIVLDVQVDDIVWAGVEMFGTTKLYDVKFDGVKFDISVLDNEDEEV